jgi:hypothetical protein
MRKRQLSLLLSFLPEKKEEKYLVKNVSGLRYGLLGVFYPFTTPWFKKSSISENPPKSDSDKITVQVQKNIALHPNYQ